MTTFLKWMRIAAAAAVVVAVALLAWQCIDIYLDGNAPDNLDANGVHLQSVYSREIVGGRLRMLGLPLILCLAVLAASGVLHLIFARDKAPRAGLTPENRLRLMMARLETMPLAAVAEEKRRCCLKCIAGAAIVLCMAGALTYLLDGTHFTDWELEGVMGQMLLHVGPWVIVGFAAAAACSVLCGRSVERELTLLKGAPMTQPAQTPPAPGRNAVPFLRAALYVLAIVFIVLGVMNGGLYDVLVKAINICTECIGLG